MSRITRSILALFALLVGGSTVAWGQTSSSTSNPIALVITPFLSCSPSRGIDFGSHQRREGAVFTDGSNYAEWQCDTDAGNSVNVTFTLPTQLTNPQATGFPVALTYGAASGFIDQNASQFNPSTGLANDIVPTGHAVVRLGWPRTGSGADELVRADISNASTVGGGHYSATVVLNVTLN
jgi:hypothetical protein